MLRLSGRVIIILFFIILSILIVINLSDAQKQNNAAKNKAKPKPSIAKKVNIKGGKKTQVKSGVKRQIKAKTTKGSGTKVKTVGAKVKTTKKPGATGSDGLKHANTTRYYDCCKPECGWYGKGQFVENKPAMSCEKDGVTMADYSDGSICYENGTTFHCTSQQPWVDPSNKQLSYAYAAAGLANQEETDWCCSCYDLTLLEGPCEGKRIIVQIVETDWGDFHTGSNGFSLLIPGAGVGYNTYGCQTMFGAPDTGWGDRYNGVDQESDCGQLPAVLQAGCKWRFTWFMNCINPLVSWRQVQCPKALTDKTDCIRTDNAKHPKPA